MVDRLPCLLPPPPPRHGAPLGYGIAPPLSSVPVRGRVLGQLERLLRSGWGTCCLSLAADGW